MNCCTCFVEAKTPNRLPKGWKKLPTGELYCKPCWRERFALRAVTIPVAGPVDGNWDDLRKALEVEWRAATRLANRLVTELASLDPAAQRKAGDEKIPSFKLPYLYPKARAWEPSLGTAATVAVLNTVGAKYNADRYDVWWRASKSLPNFQYPMPLPIGAANVKIDWLSDTERVPVLTLRLNGERFKLRLRGGPDFRRQTEAVAKCIAGAAVLGEIAIYRKTAFGSHRPGALAKAPGGGKGFQTTIMVKLPMWLPKNLSVKGDRVLELFTGGETSFLRAVLNGREDWVLHGDHVKGWIAENDRRLQSFSDDQKYEVRVRAKDRNGINGRRKSVCKRFQDRMSDFLHQTTRQIVGYAERQEVAAVVFDATPGQDYFPHFPWFQFLGLLAQKLDEKGIPFTKRVDVVEDAA
ncbi:hypothetical protein EBZ80_10465 [bacterium]|nr:hypothetical protein [bacterium]